MRCPGDQENGPGVDATESPSDPEAEEEEEEVTASAGNAAEEEVQARAAEVAEAAAKKAAEQAEAAQKTDPKTKPRHPTALRRGPAAVREQKPPKKAKASVSKDDPAHPLRKGGSRKRIFAKRPTRVVGSTAWLTNQLDQSGFQLRTLMIAYLLFKDPTKRARICKQRRETGQRDSRLPLKRRESKPPCTDSMCNCKPNYKILAGVDGGVGDATGEFVSRLFKYTFPAVLKKKQNEGAAAA